MKIPVLEIHFIINFVLFITRRMKVQSAVFTCLFVLLYLQAT